MKRPSLTRYFVASVLLLLIVVKIISATSTPQITEEKAQELAKHYIEKYLPDFKVEQLLPFAGMHHTMYSVELKNSKGELRTLHINSFGNIMPFGGPWGGGS